jgi:hypothetical protein
MVQIDWEDPEVRAILDCREGRQAWDLLQAYVIPLRDAIWARRRETKPKHGGRRAGRTRTPMAAKAASATAPPPPLVAG